MDVSQAFIEGLVREVPDLVQILEQHINEYGEILPHVFFGELTRYVLQCLRTSTASGHTRNQVILRQILGRLEDGYATGEDVVTELIGVSFLENLSGEEGREALRDLMGPHLSEALKQWD